MNIVNKLTLSHLKENKGRTVITTLGICVSVAMITAVFVAIASFMNLFGEVTIMSGGNKHADLYVNYIQLQELKDDERISRLGVQNDLQENSYCLERKASNRTGTGDMYQGDYVNLEQMFTGEYEGTIPKNENEIAVEQSLIEKNDLNWKIGDTVKIPLGYRYIIEDGEKLYVNGGYISNENFESASTSEFKITAILHNNPSTMDHYYIIQGFDSDNINLSADEVVNATIELKDFDYNSLNAIKSIIDDYDIKNYNINSHLLETKFSIDENSTLVTSIIPMAAIILAIIMIASVVLIYNAFGMSLSERVRYLGMLTSVGATRRQKKASVYFEGLILGTVGIPVGILAGIAGIGITLKAIGQKIIATGMINGVSDSGMEMDVVVPFWAITGIVLFSVLTIFISSFIPSHKASTVTPIDAIRQRNEIKIKSKRLKTPKIVRAIFGYEGELAHKNLKRNRRKSRVITASIALSVVLFLCCNYFCQMFNQANTMEMDIPYQISVGVDYDKKDEFIKDLQNIADVDNYYGVNYSYELIDSDSSLSNKEYLTSTYKNLFNSKRSVYVNQIDDEAFNQLCENNGIDYKKFYGDTVKGVIMNNISHNSGSEVFNEKILNTVYKEEGMTDVKITDFVDYDNSNYVCRLNPKSAISIYVPFSAYHQAAYSDNADSDLTNDNDEWTYLLGLETTQHKKVSEDIYALFDENEYGSTSLTDNIDTLEVMNTLVFVLQVFVYGFIALITLITVANIINTISTSIALRRKEFAMLKSVGTTPKGFRKMVSLESVFYGLKSLVFGIPISLLLSYLMNFALGADDIPFEINWLLYAAVIFVVFVIVGLSMLYSVSKLRNDNIIETLKEDIS